jgi:hypothetical protein
MLKFAQLVNDPSRFSQISNRHIVALCNLSTRIDTARSKSTQKGQYTVVSFRLDVTDDPDAVLECASAGLALMDEGYVTLPTAVQEAISEWLNTTAFVSSVVLHPNPIATVVLLG